MVAPLLSFPSSPNSTVIISIGPFASFCLDFTNSLSIYSPSVEIVIVSIELALASFG